MLDWVHSDYGPLSVLPDMDLQSPLLQQRTQVLHEEAGGQEEEDCSQVWLQKGLIKVLGCFTGVDEI